MEARLCLSLSLPGFFIPTNPPRSIFVTTCEQTVARTHARTHTRARSQRSEQVSPVCPWQIQASQTMRTGRRIHIFRCTLAATWGRGKGRRVRKRGEGGRKKKGGARKSLRIVKLWNMENNGIADTEETAMEPVQRKKERRGKDSMEQRSVQIFFQSWENRASCFLSLPSSISISLHLSLRLLSFRFSFLFPALFSASLSIRSPLATFYLRHRGKFFERLSFFPAPGKGVWSLPLIPLLFSFMNSPCFSLPFEFLSRFTRTFERVFSFSSERARRRRRRRRKATISMIERGGGF